MTITQTVEIPADRRLTIDIPREIPLGRAQVELKVIPFVKNEGNPEKVQTDTKTPHTDTLLNLLSNIGEVNIDEIRDERLVRQL